MEVFLDRLSECQANEADIRQQREALLKRHEQELINIDQRIVNIASQRNSILEEFKNFLEATPSESNPSPSPTKQRPQSFHYMPKQCEVIADNNDISGSHLQVERPSSSGGSTPISQYHSPLASPLPEIKTPIPPTPPNIETLPTLSVVENRKIIRSPIRRQNAETQLPILPEVEPSPRVCTDLKLTITKPTRKLMNSKILDSPATEKIEKILSQVRNNAHPLEEEVVNHCIDLLSSKCDAPNVTLAKLRASITKAKEPVEQQQQDAPVRRNAMRKRVETPEERQKRIESVLFGPSPEERRKQEHSNNTPNELGRTQSAIIDRSNAYNGRRSSGNVNMKQQPTLQQNCQLRRNQSLSPLRFGTNGRSLDSIEDETTDPSMEELFLRAPNSDKRYQMRRARSDVALLGDSDSFSAATSFDDDFDFEADQVMNSAMNADDQDHLLAPSKVAKSQNMFHKTLFGSETGKRLLTKEEILRERKLSTQNRLASQRARSFEHTSRYDEQQRRTDDCRSPTDSSRVPGSLRAEQLVQMRGSSASPDQRQIDRELNTVANLKRFQSYQNFWEHKTKEVLDKQKRFSTISGSSGDSRPSSRSHTMETERKTTILDLVKPETVSPKPSKKKTPKSGNSTKSAGTTAQSKTSKTVITPAVTQPKAAVASAAKEKESKSLLDRFSFFSNKKKDEQPVSKTTLNNGIIKNGVYNNNGYDHNNNTISGSNLNVNRYHNNHNTVPAQLKPEIENDQLFQRVRNIHEDIRKRKLQQQNQNNIEHRPSIQSAKSLDLQYYALKAKQVPVKLIEPNGPEPGLAKNRFRLIKTPGSKDEHSSDDNFDALSQVSFASTGVSDCSVQHMRPHNNRINTFRETTLHKPMKSTYF